MSELTCPRCLEIGGVRVNLSDAVDFNCANCSEDFTRDNIDAIIADWTVCLKWLDTHPDSATPAQ